MGHKVVDHLFADAAEGADAGGNCAGGAAEAFGEGVGGARAAGSKG